MRKAQCAMAISYCVYMLIAFLTFAILASLAVNLWLIIRRRSQAVVFVRSWKRLTGAEIAGTLAEWPMTDPRWRAVWDLLDMELAAEVETLESVASIDSAMANRVGGRVQVIMALRRQMLAGKKATL